MALVDLTDFYEALADEAERIRKAGEAHGK